MGSEFDEDGPLSTWGSGTAPSNARRAGDVVLRRPGAWSRTVIALLAHYEQVGFAGAPRVIGTGFAADGSEMLSHLPGSSPHPRAWTDDALHEIGWVLRAAHDAGREFSAWPEAIWKPWFGRNLPGTDPVIGHCDVGPWNWVAQGDRPYALIDWEYAGPVDALWEVAHAAWLNAQLHDDDIADLHGLPSAQQRAGQVSYLLDGYQLPQRQRSGIVDMMIEFAVHSARAEAIQYQVEARTPDGRPSDGYPVLWAITWRARSAAWMLHHRRVLQQAIA